MPEPLLDSASARIGDELYVVGGKNAGGHTNSAYVYSLVDNSWDSIASKPGTAVENGAMVAYGGQLYFFGGSTQPFSGAIDAAYRYDPTGDSWTQIASIPQAVGGIQAEVIGDKVYIAGGMDAAGNSVRSLYIYDIPGGIWSQGPDMPAARDSAGTAAVNGQLYVMGGRLRTGGANVDGELTTFEIYEPGIGWSTAPALPRGRRSFIVGEVAGKIQIMGGEYDSNSPDHVFPEVDSYDPDLMTWDSLPPLESPRHGAAFTTWNDEVFVFGGGTESGASYSPSGFSVTFSYDFDLWYSLNSNRSDANLLEGASVEGEVYVFLKPEAGVEEVRFFLDSSDPSGTPYRVEGNPPFDFAGGIISRANPFDASALSSGSHFIFAEVVTDSGTEAVSSSFSVDSTPGLTASETLITVASEPDQGIIATPIDIGASDGASVGLGETHTAAWLQVDLGSATTPQAVVLNVNTTGLSPGNYSDDVVLSATGYQSITVTVSLTIEGEIPVIDYELLYSLNSNRSDAEPLEGESVAGNIYVFVSPETSIDQVRFFIDSTDTSGIPFRVEGNAPYDLAGGSVSNANPFDALSLSPGSHFIHAEIIQDGGDTQEITANFLQGQGLPSLTASLTEIDLTSEADQGLVGGSVEIDTSDGSTAFLSEDHSAFWLQIDLGSADTPQTVVVNADTTGLAPGLYQDELELSAGAVNPVSIDVNLTILEEGADSCAPVVCSEILVDLPYVLDFDEDGGHLLDGAGIGTGFTYIQESTNGGGYVPNLLEFVGGGLTIHTSAGIQTTDENNQDNVIGVGFSGPNQVAEISTQLVNIPEDGTGYAQAGLWFGIDEDNYVKLVHLSRPNGKKEVQYIYELNGVRIAEDHDEVGDLLSGNLTLTMVADPATKTVVFSYQVNQSNPVEVGSTVIEPEFFSFDAAGIDPEIGTRSFAGIMATHRNGDPLSYAFEYFSIVEQLGPGGGSDFSFNSKSHAVNQPTGMVWGPDGRLYVAEMRGEIHALTFDGDLNVTDDEVITTLKDAYGSRLVLGIEVLDEGGGDFSLWLAHSSQSLNDGAANSGVVSRLYGSDFSQIEDRITGLPRAKANHGPNHLHFGPDGKLYMAIGGNTGAGAPIDVPNEFGDRAEQPLSAAILVADVLASGFDGTCANNLDIYGPAPCDVSVHASGLRNSYDFLFHSNGEMYATDNGLGVTGAFPPTAAPDCSGFADPAPWTEGGDNPGEQGDFLYRILPGKYYGHPNPSRDECVFKDGSYQSASPEPNYELPLADLGTHSSANGIIEYTAGGVCPELVGNLLIVNYSLGDNINRVVLDGSGTAVVSQENLVDGFNNPLAISEMNGDLFVAEFGAGQVTALRLIDGCTIP